MRMGLQIWVAKALHIQGQVVEETVMLAAVNGKPVVAEVKNRNEQAVTGKHALVAMGKKGSVVGGKVRKMMMVGAEVNALHKVVVMEVEVVLYKAVEMVRVVNELVR